MRLRIFPLALIAIGTGLLLGKLGIVPTEALRYAVHTWWPLGLIAIGAAMLAVPRGACGHHRRCGTRDQPPLEGPGTAA